MSEYPSITAIQAAVCVRFGVTGLDLLSRRRGRHIARPRQIGYWLARHCTPASLPEIGRAFGMRDHTTVMHGIALIEELMGNDPWLKKDVQALLHRFQPQELAA